MTTRIRTRRASTADDTWITNVTEWLQVQDHVPEAMARIAAADLARIAKPFLLLYIAEWIKHGTIPDDKWITSHIEHIPTAVREDILGIYSPSGFHNDTRSVLWTLRALNILLSHSKPQIAKLSIHRWRSTGKAGLLVYPTAARFQSDEQQEERIEESKKLSDLFGLTPSITASERDGGILAVGEAVFVDDGPLVEPSPLFTDSPRW